MVRDSDGNSALSLVGEGIDASRGNWNFGGNVADSFIEHVTRSVPLYETGHELICKISDFFVYPHSTCYELGTSTGELLAKLAKFNDKKSNVLWVGVDIEEGMIRKAKDHCKDISNVELLVGDISTIEMHKCDFVVMYYCMQFMEPRLRQPLLDKIYERLNWGGALLLFEKVRAPDARFQDMMTALYNDYKTEQGYTDQEIMAKSRSLRGVLEPYTTEANVSYLKRAGFVDVMTVMKYVCFEGWLAIK